MIVKATIKFELNDVQKDWVSYIKERHGEKAVFYYLEEEVQKKLNGVECVEMEYKECDF
ncbi:hypothetical protein U9K47_14150 [Bacillus toyonensis]|uniref:hypothetical protein n=1 Tax=Bacillus toyonensis TaxID=155322 RepID=UPI003467DCFB